MQAQSIISIICWWLETSGEERNKLLRSGQGRGHPQEGLCMTRIYVHCTSVKHYSLLDGFLDTNKKCNRMRNMIKVLTWLQLYFILMMLLLMVPRSMGFLMMAW